MNINSLLLALGMFSKSVTLLPNNIKIGEFKSINTRLVEGQFHAKNWMNKFVIF